MKSLTPRRIQTTTGHCGRGSSIIKNDVIPHSPLSAIIRPKSYLSQKPTTCSTVFKPFWTPLKLNNAYFNHNLQQRRLQSTQTQVDEQKEDVPHQEATQPDNIMSDDSEDFQPSQIQDAKFRKWFTNMQSLYTKKEYEKVVKIFNQIQKTEKPIPLMYKLVLHCDAQMLEDRKLLEHAKMFLLEHGSNISTLSHILHVLGVYQKRDMFDMFWKLIEDKNDLLPNDVPSARRMIIGFCKLQRAAEIEQYLEKKRQEFPHNPHLLSALVLLNHHVFRYQKVVDLIAKALEEQKEVTYFTLRKGVEDAYHVKDWKHQEVFGEALDTLQESGSKVPAYLRLRGLFRLKDFGKMLEIFTEHYGDLEKYLAPATLPQDQIPQRQIAARMISAYGALGMEKELLQCFNFFKQVQDPAESVLRSVMLFYSKKGDTETLLKVFMEGLDKDLAGVKSLKDNKPYGKRWVHTSSITSLIYCMQANHKLPQLLEILEHLRTLPELENIFFQHNIYLNLLPVLIHNKDDRNAIKWLQYYFQNVHHPRIVPAQQLLGLLINMGKFEDAEGFVSALESASETKPDREMYHSLISMYGKNNNTEKIYEVAKQMTLLGVYPTVRTHMLIADILASHKRFGDLVQYYSAVANQDMPELQRAIANILKKNGREEELKQFESIQPQTVFN